MGRSFRILLWGFGALALLLGLAWLARVPLAEWVAERALAREGIEAEVRISRLDFSGAILDRLSAPGLELRKAEADYSPRELLEGRLRRLDIDSLSVTLPLQRAQAEPAEESPPPDPDAVLQQISRYLPHRMVLRRWEVFWPSAPLAGFEAAGRLEAERVVAEGRGDIRLAGYGRASSDPLQGELRFEGEIADALVRSLNLESSLSAPGRGLDGALKASYATGEPHDGLRLDLGLGGALEGLEDLLPEPWRGELAGMTGQAQLTLGTTLNLPRDWWRDPADWAAWPAVGAEAEGRGDIAVTDFDLPGRLADGVLAADFGFDTAAGRLRLRQEEPLRLRVGRLSPAWLEGLGLPPGSLPLLEPGGDLRLETRGAGPLLQWRGEAGGRQRLNLRPDLALDLAGGGTLALAGEDVEARVSDGLGSLALRGFEARLRDFEFEGASLARLDLSGDASWAAGGLDGVFVFTDLLPQQAAADLALSGLTLPGWGEEIAVTAQPRLTRSEDAVLLDLAEGSSITASARRLDRGRLVALGLPPDLAARLARGLTVDLAGLDGTGLMRLAPAASGGSVVELAPRLDARASSGERLDLLAQAVDLTFDAPLGAENTRLAAARLRGLDLRGSGLRFAELRLPELRAQGDADWSNEDGRQRATANLRLRGQGGMEGRAERLRLDLPLTLALEREVLRLRPGADGTLQVENAALEGLRLTRPSGEVRLSGGDVSGELEARLSQLTAEPLFEPMTLAVSGRSQNGRARGEASLRQPQRPILDATFQHLLASGAGEARFEIGPLDFMSGFFEPVDTSALAGDLRQVSGGLSAEGQVAWDRNGLGRSSGRLQLDGLGFRYDMVSVEGLRGEIALSSLWPLRTQALQQLTARRINAGLPIDGVEAFFSLDESGSAPLRMTLDRARGQFLGGEIALAAPLILPFEERAVTAVTVDRLDLSALSDLLGSDQVSMTGRLSGGLPLLVEAGAVTSSGGRLENVEPGVLVVRSDAARQALSAAGEAGRLMLDALEDFRYRHLSVDFTEVGLGQTELGISLEGSNPAVLDDHPFVFNIALETELLPLMTALRATGQLSDDVLDELLRITN